LQGLQTALTGANTLGTLGSSQYNQQMGINQLQNLYGTQQQGQMQNILNNQYTDYTNAKNYPYKQLGFMSDMLRGLPLTANSSTMYQAAPSTVSQLAGLGTAAYGLSTLGGSTATAAKAKGGAIKAKKQSAGLADLALASMA